MIILLPSMMVSPAALQRHSSYGTDYPSCRICGTPSTALATKVGNYAKVPFHLFRCPDCRFAFIDPPWTGLSDAYNEAYYRAQGVDWTVDYVYELEPLQATDSKPHCRRRLV